MMVHLEKRGNVTGSVKVRKDPGIHNWENVKIQPGDQLSTAQVQVQDTPIPSASDHSREKQKR